jgi:hypothetical protein
MIKCKYIATLRINIFNLAFYSKTNQMSIGCNSYSIHIVGNGKDHILNQWRPLRFLNISPIKSITNTIQTYMFSCVNINNNHKILHILNIDNTWVIIKKIGDTNE